jgi:serine/threonine protein phosphatase 1
MKSRICIGDVHGCFLTLIALVDKLPKDVPISICGDLIDRGPRSREVVQWCIDNKIDVVMGNHEEMMATNNKDVWLRNGGYECLESYGCQVVQTGHDSSSIYFPEEEMSKIYNEHVEYIKNLPLVIEYPDVVNAEGRYLVVSHSNLVNMWKSYKKDPDHHYFKQNVLWGRPNTIKDATDIYNIHGHTPIENGPKIKVPFANIDTGCCFPHFKGLGTLTALQYPSMIIYTQKNLD